MEFLLSLLLFVLPASITPGPNNIMILTSGLNHGARKTLPHFLGIITGFPMMILSIGFGLSAVFDTYPIIHDIIKYLGFIYLCYLAFKITRSSGSVESSEKKEPFTFFEAALFQWVNPKAWIMAITAVSTFAQQGDGFVGDVLKISLTFALFGSPCVAIWMFGGVWLTKLFKNQKQLVFFNYSMALLLVGSLIPIFL